MTGIHLLLDGNNCAYRANCVTELYTKDGRRSSAIHGVLNITHSTIEKVSQLLDMPVKEVIYGWDYGHAPRRKEVFPEYKANRKKDESDEDVEERKEWMTEFIEQANQLHQNLPYFGVKSYKKKDWEGDDILYAFKVAIEQRYPEDTIVIVSTDEDFHQLVNGNTCLFSPVKEVMYTPDNYEELMGIPQECFLTYKILNGDGSDGIPGIKGIGPKTSKNLVNQYGNIDMILSHKADLMKSKVTSRIFTQEGLEILDRNNKLINLADYVVLDEVHDDIEGVLDEEPYVDTKKVKDFLMSYQLTSILAKYKQWIETFREATYNYNEE